MKPLPGFRDFFPEDAAARAALFDLWRCSCQAFGFQEVDAPILEPIDLYKKKSGDELVGQLFEFTDRGGRHVALRPEMTPTLARMIAARERHYRKPIKWFSIGNYFRFERQQKGRLREFTQLNCDLVGDASADADAEIIALLVDLLRATGLGPGDFAVRVSDRNAWNSFLEQQKICTSHLPDFLSIIDKMDRLEESKLNEELKPFKLTIDKVRQFASQDCLQIPSLAALHQRLEPRGVLEFVKFDLSIVRGLAYYTGVVFEAFDPRGEHRAIAGGGRYDSLLSKISDGTTDLPAIGFAVGDVVLMDLIRCTPAAAKALTARTQNRRSIDVYAVIADESMRRNAIHCVAELRRAGIRTDYSLAAAKVARQFQNAEQASAKFAIVFGSEWPMVRLKNLATREETTTEGHRLTEALRAAL